LVSWKPIEDYIDNQFEQYYRDETGLNRRNIKDNRVHCCLYFIPPYGHGYLAYSRFRRSRLLAWNICSSPADVAACKEKHQNSLTLYSNVLGGMQRLVRQTLPQRYLLVCSSVTLVHCRTESDAVCQRHSCNICVTVSSFRWKNGYLVPKGKSL